MSDRETRARRRRRIAEGEWPPLLLAQRVLWVNVNPGCGKVTFSFRRGDEAWVSAPFVWFPFRHWIAAFIWQWSISWTEIKDMAQFRPLATRVVQPSSSMASVRTATAALAFYIREIDA